MTLQHVQMSDGEFSKLRAIVHTKTGITIGETRKTMLTSRLKQRLREAGEPDFSAYIKRLSMDADEVQEMVNRVTTNETYFYRTPRVWEHFLQTFVPEFHEKSHGRPLKLWSAAASTGEEAHTIASLMEQERLAQKGFDYSVLGTDVSSRVLGIAEEGLYNGRSIARFREEKPDVFAAQMVGDDDAGYKVTTAAKSRIKFKLHNLLEPLKNAGPFDVVFLRNVLIYFTPEDQTTIIKNVRDVIRPDGVLFIGESETLNGLDVDFEKIAPIIYRPTTRVT